MLEGGVDRWAYKTVESGVGGEWGVSRRWRKTVREWKAALPVGRLSMREVGCEKFPWSTQRGKMRGRLNGTRGTDAMAARK